MKKIYDDMQSSANVIVYMVFNTFTLKVFNRLTYDQEINSPLVASYLLRLPDYYILLANIKSINLTILWKYFSEFALHIYKP